MRCGCRAKVTLITGGESGIGLATARRFVGEGAKVYFVGLDEGRLKDAVRKLGSAAGYSAWIHVRPAARTRDARGVVMS